jgi:two-component system CheB/CheR fusion protein
LTELVTPEDGRTISAWTRSLKRGAAADYAGEHRLVRKDGALVWAHVAAKAFQDEQGAVDAVAIIVQDIGATKAAQERQAFLLAELQHRTRNLLAVIRGIASRSAEGAGDVETFLSHLLGRLGAVARTQASLTRSAEVSVSLGEILDEEFLAAAASSEQVSVRGPELWLRGKAAETMSLGLHELATNALKYGALASPRGRLEVSWTVEGEAEKLLRFSWRESGVKTIDLTPSRVGFGRKLIEEVLPYELGAETSLRFAPGGLHATIDLPLDEQRVDIGKISESAN